MVATTRCFSNTRSADWSGLHHFLGNREPQHGI